MMHQQFIDYLQQFGSLNHQQIELINANVVVKIYPAGEYFLKANEFSREIGFILEGVFRVCYYDKDGNEITRYFLDENHFIADVNSYNSGIPSVEYIQSVVDSKVLVLTKAAMQTLSETIIVWDAIVSKITAKALTQKVRRVSLMMPQDATERYVFFLDNFPNLVNRVPLNYIASYIGITKSSLSRLRREFSKRK